jgi:hypothetical protein
MEDYTFFSEKGIIDKNKSIEELSKRGRVRVVNANASF